MKNGMKELLEYRINKMHGLKEYLKDPSPAIRQGFFKEVMKAATEKLYFEALANNSVDKILEEIADPKVTEIKGLTANELKNFKAMVAVPESQKASIYSMLRQNDKLIELSGQRQMAATQHLINNVNQELEKYHDVFVDIFQQNGITMANCADYGIDFAFTQPSHHFQTENTKPVLDNLYTEIGNNVNGQMELMYRNEVVFLNGYYQDELRLYFDSGLFNEPLENKEAHKAYEFILNTFNNPKIEKNFEPYAQSFVNNGRVMPAKVLFDHFVSTREGVIKGNLDNEYKKVLLGQDSNYGIHDFDHVVLNQLAVQNKYEEPREMGLSEQQKKDVLNSITTDDVVAAYTDEKVQALCAANLTKESATKALTALKSLQDLHAERGNVRKFFGWLFGTACGKEGAMIDKIRDHLMEKGMTKNQINAALESKENLNKAVQSFSTEKVVQEEIKHEEEQKEWYEKPNDKMKEKHYDLDEQQPGYEDDEEIEDMNNYMNDKNKEEVIEIKNNK